MLDHVSITVRRIAPATEFYDAVFAVLGYPCVRREADVIGYGLRNGPDDDSHTYISVRATGKSIAADGRHWCFRAASRDAVDAFYVAGLATGGRGDGAPGLRPHYHDAYYAAFLLDPDGNRIEAVCHRRP